MFFFLFCKTVVMQYLQNNKVNYLPKSVPFIWTGTDIYQDDYLNYITYPSLQYNTHVYTHLTQQSTGTHFTLWTINPKQETHLIVYNIRPSFTCSNFMDINHLTSSDTITFTVTMNDKTRTYTYPLQQHPINFFNITDYILFDGVLTSMSFTATSTVQLTLMELINYEKSANGKSNMRVLLY